MKSLLKLLKFVLQHPLNRSDRIGAIRRLVGWQLGSRLLPGATAVPFVGRTRIILERGMTGATGNYYCGLHEFEEMALVLHVLREGNLFVDVGANVGSYSLLAVGGANARAIAVEPVPNTFEKLQRNAIFNGLGENLECLQIGISSAPGFLKFTCGLDTVNHVAMPDEMLDTVEVQVRTLDDIVPKRDATVIKVDVEGHESAVLAGGRSTLSSPSVLVVIMETNGSGERYGVGDQDLHAEMKVFGFKPYRYDPFERTLFPASEVVNCGNTIFIRDVELVQQRVRAARRFQLVNGAI